MFISSILVAGGRGTRFQNDTPKQFIELQGRPVARHSYDLLASLSCIQEIIVVCDPEYRHLFPSDTKFAEPGERRQDTVWNGLKCLSPNAEFVCIHDSARPFVSKEDIENVIQEALVCKAATLASPVKYTIKKCDPNKNVLHTVDRSALWEIHTPQVISVDLLKEGFRRAELEGFTVTDDVSLIEQMGHPVKVVHGRSHNLKITYPEDWQLAQWIAECSSTS